MAYRNARPGKKHPNFQEIYDLDDIKVTGWMFHTPEAPTVKPEFSPVALFGCNEVDLLHVGEFRYGPNEKDLADMLHFCTLRYLYALRVWEAAVKEAQHSDEFSALFPYWVDRDESFRMLVQREGYCSDLLGRFWTLMKRIAESGEIQVCEGLAAGDAKIQFRSERNPLFVALDASSAQEVRDRISDVLRHPYCSALRFFRWDEIEEFFGEVSLAQRELLMYKQMHRCEPIDRWLFKACGNHDLLGVKDVVERGANVNALDEEGQSALQYVVEYCYFYGTPEDEAEMDKVRRIVLYLLGKGADIDLYGYFGQTPLVCAADSHNPEMVKFLLAQGADPNVNCELAEDSCSWGVSSTPLQWLDERIDDDFFDEEQAKWDDEIESLISKAGGRLTVWGWNPAERRITGRPFICIWPFKLGIFEDSSGFCCGDAHFVRIEREGRETEVIALDSVPELKVWYDEFLANYERVPPDQQDPQWWLEWRERGALIAKKIRELLPLDVDFYYLTDSDRVFLRYCQSFVFDFGRGYRFVPQENKTAQGIDSASGESSHAL